MVKTDVRVIDYSIFVASRIANRLHAARKNEPISLLFIPFAFSLKRGELHRKAKMAGRATRAQQVVENGKGASKTAVL
jgi:hypothetical protein